MMKIKAITTLLFTLLFILTTACQASWQVEIRVNGQEAGKINDDLVNFYVQALADETNNVTLARVLYHHGFTLIDAISLYEAEVLIQSFDWETVAEDARITHKGEIIINGEAFNPSRIEINPSPQAAIINLTIMDIAPTIAQVLGLPGPPDAHGQSQFHGTAVHAVMILIDGLQYQKLQCLIAQGSLPFFDAIEEIHQGITVYPSITTSAIASLLTGTPPQVNGVYGYGYRSTDVKTLFDLAAEKGRSVTAVEGHSLPFSLRNAKVILSGDRDGDGFTDDNVLGNSLAVIHSDMPDLLLIHFHDVDDLGHSYGPDSSEYENAIIRVDDYLSHIYQILPANTFITIFADHGMEGKSDGSGGHHGLLHENSMVIPIIFIKK